MFDVTPKETERINWFFFASKRGASPREAASVRVLDDSVLSVSSDEDLQLNVVDVFYCFRTLSGTILVAREKRGRRDFIEGRGADFRDMSAGDVRLPRLSKQFTDVLREVDAAAQAAARC